jgi:ssDNA-binding Zn-finger/Zn-ribbon topoisomerase 1
MKHLLCVLKHRWKIVQVIHYINNSNGIEVKSTGIVQECMYCGEVIDKQFINRGHIKFPGYTSTAKATPSPKSTKKKATLTLVPSPKPKSPN